MAMPTMKTMIIATTAYMTVVFEAKPLRGVAVGAGVAEGGLARSCLRRKSRSMTCVPANVAVTV